ncbi:hypothetical protein BMS3Abin03_01615 [bacterium BMS3Abin03]|nr:hypothetical protein BMS3Abin03_01615 [bacterium BMS3Abin03]
MYIGQTENIDIILQAIEQLYYEVFVFRIEVKKSKKLFNPKIGGN